MFHESSGHTFFLQNRNTGRLAFAAWRSGSWAKRGMSKIRIERSVCTLRMCPITIPRIRTASSIHKRTSLLITTFPAISHILFWEASPETVALERALLPTLDNPQHLFSPHCLGDYRSFCEFSQLQTSTPFYRTDLSKIDARHDFSPLLHTSAI